MVAAVTKAGGTPDLFTPDGFNAALMIVHAVKEGKGDVEAIRRVPPRCGGDGAGDGRAVASHRRHRAP